MFVSDSDLTPEERSLLDKMIVAMRLGAADAQIIAAVPAIADQALLSDAAFITEHRQRLRTTISDASPELVIFLGAWTLGLGMGPRFRFNDSHGKLLPRDTLGSPAIATYHPRDLLRYPPNKRLAWADLQVAMSELGLKEP